MMRTSYGDVTAEHRAIRDDVAVVEGTHGIAWVDGPDAVSFLDGILSQDIAGMATGDVRRSFLLGPQGKLDALLWLAKGSESVAIATDLGRVDHVIERLGYYRIRVKAEIRREDRRVWSLWGPGSHRAADVGEQWSDRDGTLRIPIDARGLDRVLMATDEIESPIARAGRLAATAARVEAGEPVMDVDVDESTIPQETGLVPDSVSFTKGCYLGQELVARIDSRGHVNRRLCGVVVTRNVLPPDGATLHSADREVGVITSVSESVFVGAPIGLSLVRREVEAGDEVEVRWDGGAVPAIVRDLPLL